MAKRDGNVQGNYWEGIEKVKESDLLEDVEQNL